MSAANLRRWMLISFFVSLGAAPVRAQSESYRLSLPALYRSVATANGLIRALTTSRLTPGLALAITASQPDGEPMTVQLLRSPDGGMTWPPTAEQPWQDLPGLPYWWEAAVAVRMVRVEGTPIVLTYTPLPVLNPIRVSTNDGDHWEARSTPPLNGCPDFKAGSVLTTPAAPNRLLLAGRCLGNGYDSYPVLLASDDAARTWSVLDPWSADEPQWYGPVLASPVDPDRLYRHVQTSNWQRSDDLAATWANVVFPGAQLILSPNDSATLGVMERWAQSGFTSRDGGQTWQGWGNMPCVNGVLQSPGPIWLRGSTETLVALCGDDSLIRSRDGGQTWELRTLPGLYPVLLTADDARPDGLYVEVAVPGPWPYRLYRSLDGGDTWQDVLALSGH